MGNQPSAASLPQSNRQTQPLVRVPLQCFLGAASEQCVRERDVAGFGEVGRMQDVIDDWRLEIHQRTPYPRPAMQAVNICDQLSLDVACADAVF